ncbi:hypothetical protein NPIL_91781 [Nephila pilipes]|uniref:Uncharacterized protein n=1 Tax=Nephila pilipes TaxID=299642 RepID=A0A8X6NV47_NEPPI|nr:hypothetical protein NPIL_91781 [Nephila pilipes]
MLLAPLSTQQEFEFGRTSFTHGGPLGMGLKSVMHVCVCAKEKQNESAEGRQESNQENQNIRVIVGVCIERFFYQAEMGFLNIFSFDSGELIRHENLPIDVMWA